MLNLKRRNCEHERQASIYCGRKPITQPFIMSEYQRDERLEALFEWKTHPWGTLGELFDGALPAIESLEKRLQEAEKDGLEQARLLGMSGEREADLRGKLQRAEQKIEQLEAEEPAIMQGEKLTPARDAAKEIESLESRLAASEKAREHFKAALVIIRQLDECTSENTMKAVLVAKSALEGTELGEPSVHGDSNKKEEAK